MDAHKGKAGVSLDSLVRELKLEISGSHAARLFRHDVGIGFREYAKNKRLATAAKGLRDNARSIKQIAGDLGYRNVQHFTRAFKTAFKVSPSEYRALHNEAR
jgi:AraC family transcriptional regulator